MRNRFSVHAVLVLLMLLPVAASAQAPRWGDTVEHLRAGIEALRDSLVHGDSTTTAVARIGDLAIAASPANHSLAADALEEFARVRQHWFGNALPSADGFRIALQTEAESEGVGRWVGRQVGAVVLAGMPDTGKAVRQGGRVEPSGVLRALIDDYAAMMANGVPVVASWLGNPPTLSVDSARRRQIAMYAFVTANGDEARACVAGRIAACPKALGLTRLSAPIGFARVVRSDLLLSALELGGSGAWTRLRAGADGGIAPALAAAARMPVDSLLATWRRDMLGRHAHDAGINGPVTLAAIAWIALGALAAMGAARWA